MKDYRATETDIFPSEKDINSHKDEILKVLAGSHS